MGKRSRLGYRGRMPQGFANRFPRRFILFGERVVPVSTFIDIEAKRNHRAAVQMSGKDRFIKDLLKGKERRDTALVKAAEYIKDLKDKLRESGVWTPDERPQGVKPWMKKV